MLRSMLFQKRGKIFACIFVALIVFLWLGISGINFAQSPGPEEVEKMKSIQIINPQPLFRFPSRLLEIPLSPYITMTLKVE
jgi:hypothetical protein